MAKFKMAEFKMAAIIKLSQIEWIWVRIRVKWECFWVNLREENKVFECKMAVAESKMAEIKMTAIIKLNQTEWVKFIFESECWELDLGKWECFWEENLRWLNPRWKNSRCLPTSRWVRMNEWIFFLQNGWIEDGRFQDGCHHQVESEWMSAVYFWANVGN